MIFHRAPGVPVLGDYEAYRPYLRQDFQYRCAYCLRHEFFFGGGEAGEIDHFRPLNAFPQFRNDYLNLYWSCRKCNAVKSGKWPTADQMTRGQRFLDPCVEDHENHWKTKPDGMLTALTLTGRYTIRHIRLDRPTLIQFRRLLYGLQERVNAVEADLQTANLHPETRARLLAELDAASLLINPPIFSL